MKNISTPSGFRDVLSDEAAERERIQRSVQDLFASHGFLPIETPTLEAVDVMRASGRMPSSPFRFFDSRGDLLAMRPDVTLQVARMCATRMPASQERARLRYTQRIFRDTGTTASVSPREIKQMGVECIGEGGPSVDAELVALFAEALAVSGVEKAVIAMATASPLRALLDFACASDEWKDEVLFACHASDFVKLDELCNAARSNLLCEKPLDNVDVQLECIEAIRSLPRIRGGAEAIDEARRLTAKLICDAGLDEFEETFNLVTNQLSSSGYANSFSLLVDFSALSSFDYYTGIVFVAYSPYLGSSLGSGGRYDKLIGSYGKPRDAAGFAFSVEQTMAATEAQSSRAEKNRPLRIAVPKGALNESAVRCLEAAGLDVEGLYDIGRQLVIHTSEVDYIIVRPSDAPAFVSCGAADLGICGRDSLEETGAHVVQLADLGFGECKFVVAQPKGTTSAIEERYRRLGSIRVATKYPNITLRHFAKTGVQVDIVKLNGNIELAPLAGMAERIVDITATGTTLRENNLEIVEDVMESTARLFANSSSLRTSDKIIELAESISEAAGQLSFKPVAGKAM